MDPLILITAAVVVIVVVLAVVMMRGRKKDAPAGGATAQALDELPPDALPGAGAPSGATMVLSTVARAAAWLVLRKGGEEGSIFELQRGQVTIGSESGSGVHIDHPSISPTHALIKIQQSRYQLYDMGSENGTSVNDTPVSGAFLKDGSRISMGATEVFFSQLGGGAEGGEAGEAGKAGGPGVLLVRAGPSKGKNFQVGDKDIVLGRRPGEDGGEIDDPAVSLRHALVRPTEHGCLIYDLGSANGTKVDDVSLSGVLLQNGDVMRVGEAELQFVLEEK